MSCDDPDNGWFAEYVASLARLQRGAKALPATTKLADGIGCDQLPSFTNEVWHGICEEAKKHGLDEHGSYAVVALVFMTAARSYFASGAYFDSEWPKLCQLVDEIFLAHGGIGGTSRFELDTEAMRTFARTLRGEP